MTTIATRAAPATQRAIATDCVRPPRRASRRAVLGRHAEVEFVLAGGQALSRDRLEQLKLGVVAC